MFRHLSIENFQSHEKTEIDFHRGVNVIVGSSDTGKSAILRAVFWLIENRPLGTAFTSHWIQGAKGKLTGECKVVLTLDDGTTITRIRSEEENNYRINDDDPFDAPGTEIPAEVTELLNLTDVNVSKQTDQPFLISASAGEVARFLNRVIRMDIIDKVLSDAESLKRKTRKLIETNETEIASLREDITAYAWIPEAERLVAKLENVESSIESSQSEIDDLTNQCEEVQRHRDSIPVISDWEKVGSLLVSLYESIEENEVITEKREMIEDQVHTIAELRESIVMIDYDRAQELIEQIVSIDAETETLLTQICNIYNNILLLSDITQTMNEKKDEIDSLMAQMPDTCPLCGHLLDEEDKHALTTHI